MEIFSQLINGKIQLDGYESVGKNYIVYHNALEAFIRSFSDIKDDYRVIDTDVKHSVVICTLTSEKFARQVTAMGETCPETLSGSFCHYPTMTAMEIAFDRAAIKFLQLPTITYSNLEFLINTEKKELPGLGGKDEGDYILNFGAFTGKGLSVRQAFDLSGADDSMAATLKLYLSKTTSDIRDEIERNGVVAIQRYAAQLQREDEASTNDRDKNYPKPDVEDYILDFGIFTGKGMSVREAFLQAFWDYKIADFLTKSLGRDADAILDKKEKIGLKAIQRFNDKRKKERR